MAEFLVRLKQRKLVQWAVAYLAAAWVLLQVLGLALESYGWPRVVMHIAFGVLALGFVVMLVLAWYHCERGVQRINGVELLIIALAVGGGVLWNFSRAPAKPIAARKIASTHAASPAGAHVTHLAARQAQAPSTALHPPANSIVVLPFANLSGEKDQQYFSDGITEELTSALGQNTGLTVIAWETASKYANSTQTPQEIGKALNVAHILDGSIQHAGNAVRVSVELVSTVTGRELWSAHYDDTLQNVFAVQDKITGSIADALKVKFAGMQSAPTLNPAAHEAFLKGLAASNRCTPTDAQSARDAFQHAVTLDVNYAEAWAALAAAYFDLTQCATLPLTKALPQIRAAAHKALALDPANVDALLALAIADANDNRTAKARAEFAQALKLDPSNAGAHGDYGLVLPLEQSAAQFGEAVRLDPDAASSHYNLARDDESLGNWSGVVTEAQAIIKLVPDVPTGAFLLAFADAHMQRNQDAVRAFNLVHPATTADKQLVAAGRLAYQALAQPSLRPKALAALDRLRRDKLSPLAQQHIIPLYVMLNENSIALRMLPGLCASSPILCSDLAINPMWTPLHGDPRFEKLARQYTTIMRDTAPAPASSD